MPYNKNIRKKQLEHTRERIRNYNIKGFYVDCHKKISEELSDIYDKYGFIQFDEAIVTYYMEHPKSNPGSIMKNISKLNQILTAHGYNEEDIYNYLVQNSTIFINKPSELIVRLAIFEKTNLLEEVLFEKRYLISRPFIEREVSNDLLYAYIVSKKNKVRVEDIEALKYINESDKQKLIKKYKLDKNEMIKLLSNLNSYICLINKFSEYQKKLERKQNNVRM